MQAQDQSRERFYHSLFLFFIVLSDVYAVQFFKDVPVVE